MEPSINEPHSLQENWVAGLSSVEIRKALSAILGSTPFRSSKQIQKLLQFIVSETLAGRASTLKERAIGTAVFERPQDYDTNDDPIVRLRVGELRKRLALYYQAAPDEAIVIRIPSGSFRAVFERASEAPALSQNNSGEDGQEAEHSEAPQTSRDATVSAPSNAITAVGKSPLWWLAIAISVAIVALIVLINMPSAEDRALNRFWAPVLHDPRPVLVHLGNNAVFDMSDSFKDRYHKDHPLNDDEKMGFENYFSIPPGTTVPAEDLSVVRDLYHTNGDVTATISIASLLVRKNRQFDLRYGSDLTYGDFRQYPTVLIGAHNNYWVMSVTSKLRFGFEGYDAIVDRYNPGKQWVADADRNEDYAIVCRQLDSSNGRAFIIVAGVGHGGTSAAAAFITNPQSIVALSKVLPKDWEKKNLEVVLHASVKNQIPGNPDIVASHTW